MAPRSSPQPMVSVPSTAGQPLLHCCPCDREDREHAWPRTGGGCLRQRSDHDRDVDCRRSKQRVLADVGGTAPLPDAGRRPAHRRPGRPRIEIRPSTQREEAVRATLGPAPPGLGTLGQPRPLAGPLASQLFAAGLLASSLIAVPVLAASGAYLLAEA